MTAEEKMKIEARYEYLKRIHQQYTKFAQQGRIDHLRKKDTDHAPENIYKLSPSARP